MLLSSPRNDRQRRASLLLAGVLLCVIFSNVCASLPERKNKASRIMHTSLHHSFPEASVKSVTNKGEKVFYPVLDEEIDFLHSVIEKQISEIKTPKPSKQHVTSSQTNVKSKSGTPKQKQRSHVHTSSVVLPTTANPPVSAQPNTPTPQTRATGVEDRLGPIAVPVPRNDTLIVMVISLFILVGIVAVILAAVFFVRLKKESHLAQKVDYPAFGGGGNPPTTTNGTSMGDKTLAQSAQMYHYQHQKQQMLSMGKHQPEQEVHDSEVTSDEEEVGGDFTVYECPGLAPTGEMEVKNPLFDDSTLHYQGNHK